jgi:hypothetical protein
MTYTHTCADRARAKPGTPLYSPLIYRVCVWWWSVTYFIVVVCVCVCVGSQKTRTKEKRRKRKKAKTYMPALFLTQDVGMC